MNTVDDHVKCYVTLSVDPSDKHFGKTKHAFCFAAASHYQNPVMASPQQTSFSTSASPIR